MSRSRSTSRRRRTRRQGRVRRVILAFAALVLVVLGAWTLYLDGVVREKFEGKKWQVPARVYARPLELYRGRTLNPARFERELQTLGYRPVERLSGPGQYARETENGQRHYRVHSRGFRFWDGREPARRFELTLADERVRALTGSGGDSLALMRLEPEQIGGIFPGHGEDRLLLRLEDIPPLLGETLLAVEDRGFLDHWGISPTAIARAAWANLRAGRVVQGGSTLTQQLVKNFYLTHERSLWRKSQEAVMALLLELHYSKSEILETYLNEVYLGQRGPRAVHGFALGARHYFRQPLAELDTEQLALLVALVKGASHYNPWRHPERARKRRNLVLDIMAEEGLIDPTERDRARSAPLGIVPNTRYSLQSYPAFIDLVRRQLRRDYREEDLQGDGLRIFTSLSPPLQKRMEASISERLQRLEAGHDAEGLQGAGVMVSVGSGEVLALVGDRKARFDGFNRALDARRPIGSLVKPFVYLAALEEPDYHPGTLISDEPVVVEAGDGSRWQPRNFDRVSHGEVPLYQGLVHSYNQATVRLGMTLGLEAVHESLERAGFDRELPAVPSLLLGAVAMSPYEVAQLYHTLAAEGVYTPLRAIRAVTTAEGEPLKRYPLSIEQRLSPAASFQVQYLLRRALREGTGASVAHRLPEDLALAGKTGTSDDNRDSWFAGFGGRHQAVVWLGRDDNGPTPLSGATGALQVWADLMAELPTEGLSEAPPDGVVFRWLDAETGEVRGRDCEGAVPLPLREAQAPPEPGACGRGPDWWQRLWR